MLFTAVLALAPFAAQHPVDITMEPGYQVQASRVGNNSFGRATSACDDFNRANSASMGADWIEQTGDMEVALNHGHGVVTLSLMTHANASGSYLGSTVSARFGHGGGLVYVAAVAGYAGLSDNVFVKVQDNDLDGYYDRVFFYYGNNGGSWGQPFFYFDLATPTISGNMTLSFDSTGDIAYLDIENDASGLTESFSSSGLLSVAALLGQGYGIGTYGSAYFDDVSINGGCGGSLVYSIVGLTGGGTATLTVTGATAGGGVLVGYSLTGAGPTMTPFGMVDMSMPITQLPTLTADAAGVASLSTGIPGRATGFTLYSQGADLASGALTNSLAEPIL
jgi:hypothetical protein